MAQVKGGFHRTRYSMSMSESAHKKHASDSELPDVDPPNIDDLRAGPSQSEDDGKAAAGSGAAGAAANASSVVTPPPDKDESGFAFDEKSKKPKPKSKSKENNKEKNKSKSKSQSKSKSNSKGGSKTSTNGNNNKGKSKTAKKATNTGSTVNKNKKTNSSQAKSAKKVKDSGKGGKSKNNGKNDKSDGKGKEKENPKGGKHERKVSVSKKPNLKASNAKKMKEDKKRKSHSQTPNKSSKTKHNQSKTENESGINDLANDGSDDYKGSKTLPWFLSGGAKAAEKSVGGKQRTWHEKKKDARNDAIFREQAKMEAEMLSKYHEYANNMNGKIDELSMDNDEKKKELSKDECDLSGKLEKVDFGGMVVDVCAEMLVLLDESWEGRLDIVEELCNQLIDCYEKNNAEEYYLKFCKFIFPICQQFADWRSSVILGMKHRIGRLVESTPEYFLPFTTNIMRSLLPCFAVRIEVLRDAAIDLGEKIVASCHKYDSDHLLVDSILEGLNNKHDFARCTMAEYLEYIMRSFPVLENGDGTFKDEKVLNKIDECIRVAVKDRYLETRTNGYRALHIYEKISPSKSKDIISGFSKAVTRKYQDVVSRKNSI